MDTSDPLSPPRRFRASGNGAGAISRTPPTWPTTLTRILATVESPRIPVAEAYGGVGWRDVANPNDAVIVLIPQNPYLKVGDTLTLYWGDASRPVDTHVLNQDDLLGSVSMRVPVSNIVNTGDGPIKVWYVAFMDQPVTSPATTVTVKTTVPGGIDPDPVDTPYRNENLLAPTVSPNIVDATQAQNGVTVTVPLWENMATGDKLRVRWGTASVYHAPLQPGEVGAPVVVTIDQQTILAAGDSAQLMVTYDITDIVSQWSNNSMPAYAQVDASNAIFDAPYVVDARGGVIDVDKLGDKDATVLITVKAPIAVGDTIHLIFDGQSNAGLPVREESDAPVAAGDQFVHMAIGHSALVQVAPGTASLYYRVKRNGVDEGRSQSTFLNIAGTASTLAAPTVLEARGNTLDPRDTTNGAHVQIAPWSGMAVGDEVLLYWNGTAANGRPLTYMDDATIAAGGVNTPVTFTVPPEYVDQIAGGSVDVYYRLKQGTAQRESQHLLLSVVGQILLPAPLVQGVVAGVLDPAQVPNGSVITVPPWTTMNIDDRIDWYWSAQVAAGSANGSVKVTALTKDKAIEIPVARSVIDADAAVNALVTVRYTLTRVGTPTPQDSSWNQFSVSASQTKLPAPLVDQNNGGTLDPDTLPPAGATVRVKPYAGMADGDSVMVYFGRGSGGGEYAQKFDVTRDTVGQDITMPVPKAKVLFFLNSQVVVNYVVTRFADQKSVDSSDLVLLVQGQAKWPAPGVDEAQGDYLDIDALPNGVTTRVYSSTDMQRNDVIDLSWGNPGDAGYFDDSINVSTPRDYRFRLTQDEVLPWKGRVANISYTVTRGAQVFNSNVLMLRVGASVQQQLPMPSILEAPAGVLNPDTLSAGQATAQVPVYSGMASGDQIHLVWGGGPGSGGLEWYIDVSSAMVSANKPIQRPIPLANITPFLNKTATLFYTVDNGSPVLRTSPELDVRVERQSSELLPPRVPSLNNGVLDPRTVPDAGVVVIVTYVTGMLQGDTVRLHWDNTIAAGTDQSDRIVGSQPTDIQFSVPRDKIYAGINGTVDVWYEWLRGGVRQGASTGLDFTIKLPALPPATIDQAVGTVLNPDDVPATGATVRIDSSAAFQQGDQIELRWTGLPGAGSGTFLYNAQDSDVGKDVTITVDKSIVVADTGQTVTLDYTLMRAAGGQDETSPPSVYDVRREIGSGDVLVMGARFHGGIYRASAAPQYLRALDKTTRGDLIAEWRYDDESTWIQDTTFQDTRPWVALKVRTKSGQVTINPVNIIGSGSDADVKTPVAALTALLSGDSVTCWGAPDYGNNISPTIMTYTNVVEISSTQGAFAARLSNGRVVPWGNAALGGTMPASTNIINAKRIFGNGAAFVAVEGNGTLAAWGDATKGGTLSAEAAALSDVVTIASSGGAFCALRRNNQVTAWGPSTFGGDVPSDIKGFNDIVDVRGNYGSFCALRGNGHVVAWRRQDGYGGDVPSAIATRSDIAKLASASARAFAVLTTGGEVLAWGPQAWGGTVPTDVAVLNDIKEVSATWGAFCARRSNGYVVAWGDPARGGNVPTEIALLNDIVQVASTASAFAALRRNGTVVAWPATSSSGNTAAVASQLVNIRAVYSDTQAFVALKEGGGVVTWGVPGAGGDSAGVKSILDSRLFYQATSGGISYATEQGKAIAALDV